MIKPNFKLPNEKIVRFCKKYYISSMLLFGSVLTSEFNAKSDVDFLVEFQPDHIPTLFDMVTMEEELSNIIGRPADLKTPNGISRYFRDEVLASAKKIYG